MLTRGVTTVVEVFGKGFGADVNSCWLGGEMYVGEVVSGERMRCAVVGGGVGTVNLLAGSREAVYSKGGGVEVTVSEAVSIDSLEPSRGPTSGGVVTLIGSNFLKSSSLTCRFGDATAAGSYLSATTAICVSPSRFSGNVSVDSKQQRRGLLEQQAAV